MACVGKNLFPVEHAQIKCIWCHHSDTETGTDTWSGWQATLQGKIKRGRDRERRKLFDTNWGPGPRQAPVLRGIPDGAFDFQLLFELVGKETQKRLEATRVVFCLLLPFAARNISEKVHHQIDAVGVGASSHNNLFRALVDRSNISKCF